MSSFKNAIKIAYSIVANDIRQANGVGNTSPQSYEDYLIKGPHHIEEQESLESLKQNKGYFVDYNVAIECLRKERGLDTQDSIAWDKCGCHRLPQEMQLNLRRQILMETEDFYSTAKNKTLEKTAIDRANDLLCFGFNKNKIAAAIENLDIKKIAYTDDLKNRKICVIGPPSTQRSEICKRLEKFCGIKHFTVEKMLEYGVNNGFIKDEARQDPKLPEKLIEIFYHHIHDNHDGYIIEGYPINEEQVTTILCDLVVFVDVDLKTTVDYQSNRRWCSTCMRIYNLIDSKPFREENKCDRCGSNLQVRPEDKPEFIKDSYYTYRKQIKDILKPLRKENKILEIDPSKNVEEQAVTIDRIFTRKDEKTNYRKQNISIIR